MGKMFQLLQEVVQEPVSVQRIDEQTGKRSYFLEGIFLQGAIKNRNGRRYPMDNLRGAVGKYNESYITKNRAMGELGHPDGPTINLDRVCMLIKDLKEDGNNYVGKGKITDTPMGKICQGLLDEGVTIGVSSRAMGTLREASDGVMEVQNDLQMSAIDVVADPSAPDAFVRGVMENANWVYDETNGWRMAQASADARERLNQLSIRQIQESKVREFERWLNSAINSPVKDK